MTSMGQHTRILNYHYYKYIIFNFSNLITFYWAKKSTMRANGYSAWVRCSRSTGPMLFLDRMNVLSVNATMEPVLLYMEHIISCLLTSKTNEIILCLIFNFGCLLFIKRVFFIFYFLFFFISGNCKSRKPDGIYSLVYLYY